MGSSLFPIQWDEIPTDRGLQIRVVCPDKTVTTYLPIFYNPYKDNNSLIIFYREEIMKHF